MSDVENFNVNMNLVGFGLDATDKFTKQIDTINRMNAAQDRLKYFWGIGKQIQNCQVHFVISSPLPAYLENSSDPVLTNQNIETGNIIPCPYPVTTFDLMDILAYVETLVPESRLQANTVVEEPEEATPDAPVDFASLSLYERARLGLNNSLSQIETPAPTTAPVITNNNSATDTSSYTFKAYQPTPPPTEAPKKDTFTTYGSFSMENAVHKSSAPEPKTEPAATEKPIVSSWTNAYARSNIQQTESTPSPTEAPRTPAPTPAPNKPTGETFIRYGSLKNADVDDTSSQKVAAAAQPQHTPNVTVAPTPTATLLPPPAPTLAPTLAPTQAPTLAPTSAPIVTPPPATAAPINTPAHEDPQPASTHTTDIWPAFLQQQQGLISVQEPPFYFDAEQKNIVSAYKNATELAYGLIKQTEIVSESVKSIPNELKKLPLASVLWSYGLHHPHAEQLLHGIDLENHEWKLKGFPRFGLWETHPTWLFLATFFAQKHQSIFAAQAKGKADASQIKSFICAAKLAGLTWDSRPLAADIKQQQLAELSAHPHQESASWISRLRNKLHINEHFES